MLKRDPSSPKGYRAPFPGEIYKNPYLARTIRQLAQQGKRGFYEGPVAQSIVEAIVSRGGVLELDDLRAHADRGSEITEPLSFRLDPRTGTAKRFSRKLDLWEPPPNSQGIVALMAFGIMQHLISSGAVDKFSREEHNTPRYEHNS
jgi:gamma-glutamyltranspeptidase / glutathione hydrolase